MGEGEGGVAAGEGQGQINKAGPSYPVGLGNGQGEAKGKDIWRVRVIPCGNQEAGRKERGSGAQKTGWPLRRRTWDSSGV